ncbi:MAG: hypothetical protein QOJ12_1630, partial [Thermoleophilales bacterium]|nr:hypothetical protein [Thermoleophilales bacterium]
APGDVYQAPLRVSRCGRPATHFRRPASALPSLGTSGNVDLDRLGRLVEAVLDRVLHGRDVDSVIALDPGQRTELAQEIWRDAERAGGDVQTAGAAVEAAGRSERCKRCQDRSTSCAPSSPCRRRSRANEGALGLAVLGTIATNHTNALVADGHTATRSPARSLGASTAPSRWARRASRSRSSRRSSSCGPVSWPRTRRPRPAWSPPPRSRALGACATAQARATLDRQPVNRGTCGAVTMRR